MSRLLVDEFFTWLKAQAARVSRKSDLGEAMAYILKRQDGFPLFLDDGRVDIDSNLVENAIRPTAIGKKNWLFFGSPNSGQDSAILYSLIETCRKLNINPADYLRELFEALPTMEQKEVSNWTPSKWEASCNALATPTKV